MRILLIISLLLCYATVMAQQTVITTGPISLGIQVRDSKTDQLYDISKLCDGFRDNKLPINLWIPFGSQIIMFLPEVTKENGSSYRIYRDNIPGGTLKNFNYVYKGDSVGYLSATNRSEGSSGEILIQHTRKEAAAGEARNDNLKFRYRVDWREPEILDIFLIEEMQKWLIEAAKDPFNDTRRTYDDWLDEDYADSLDRNGLPINPEFPHYTENIVFLTSRPRGVLRLRLYGGKSPRDLEYLTPEDNMLSVGDLSPGSYLLVIENLAKKYGTTSNTYPFTITTSFWHQGGYWLVIILPLFIIAFIVYRYLTRRKIQKLDLMQKLSEAELKAIRAQLNPHFLFNALNAIQNLVNKQDTDTANDYIVKLSRLLRMVLSQSDDTLHAMAEEVEISKLYLELENMRTPFSYDINIASEVSQNMLVPSMILQPYLENAVIHGVVNGKAPHIQVSIFHSENACVMEVSDNGSGSDKGNGNGKGMSMGKERLDIITRQLGKKVKASVLTRKLPEGGFRVTIEIPRDL